MPCLIKLGVGPFLVELLMADMPAPGIHREDDNEKERSYQCLIPEDEEVKMYIIGRL